MLSELGRAALEYAESGLCSVFPLWPRRKEPLSAEALGFESSEGGELLGTRDLATIERWWRLVPNANIGAALRYGPLFVLDVDARNDGHHSLAALAGVDALDTLTSVSGSGWPSRHHWFVRPERAEGLVCTGVARGLDLKGVPRGYVVLPPSVHPNGSMYEWHDFADPRDAEIAACPDWLLTAVLMNASVTNRRGQIVDCAEPGEFPRGRELVEAGWPIGAKLKPGVWLAQCPNASEHTRGSRRRRDSSCVLMAPSTPNGRGRLLCSHAHCSHVR